MPRAQLPTTPQQDMASSQADSNPTTLSPTKKYKKRNGKRSSGPFACTVSNCDRCFGSLEALTKHVSRFHSDEQSRTCFNCGWVLSSKDSMKRHVKSRSCWRNKAEAPRMNKPVRPAGEPKTGNSDAPVGNDEPVGQPNGSFEPAIELRLSTRSMRKRLRSSEGGSTPSPSPPPTRNKRRRLEDKIDHGAGSKSEGIDATVAPIDECDYITEDYTELREALAKSRLASLSEVASMLSILEEADNQTLEAHVEANGGFVHSTPDSGAVLAKTLADKPSVIPPQAAMDAASTITHAAPPSPIDGAPPSVNTQTQDELEQAHPPKSFEFTQPTTFEDIRRRLHTFAEERDWNQYHTVRNLTLALVGEVGELAECFQWRKDEDCEDRLRGFSEAEKQHVAEELADVLLYLIRLSDKCGVDLPMAGLKKLEKNAAKYPAQLVRGSHKKDTEYNRTDAGDAGAH